MRRLVAACALLLCVAGSAASGSTIPTSAAAATRKLILTGGMLGVYRSADGHGYVNEVDCEARAQGQIAVLTQITSCKVTLVATGKTIKGVTPVTVPGPEAATVGAGQMNDGLKLMCISAHATYAFPAESISKTECFYL